MMKPESILKQVWDSPAYKAEVAKLIEEAGGVCEWCHHKAGDTYVDSKGVTRKRNITVHHREKPDIGLGAYKRISRQLLRDWIKVNETEWHQLLMEARMSFPYEATDADALKRATFNWRKEHRQRIDSAYTQYRAKVIEVYRHPTKKTSYVTCSRCHTAREKGKVICKVCLERYHDPKYPTCSVCAKEIAAL